MIDIDSGYNSLYSYEVDTQSQSLLNLAAYSAEDASDETWYVLQMEEAVGLRVL